MSEIFIHQRENNSDTESFLQENVEKFTKGCRFVLKLLYQGKRLSAKMLTQEYDIAEGGRRLRELFAERKDIIREWKLDSNGKRLYKEYYMDIPPYPSKSEVVERAGKVIEMMKKVVPNDLKQTSLFP